MKTTRTIKNKKPAAGRIFRTLVAAVLLAAMLAVPLPKAEALPEEFVSTPVVCGGKSAGSSYLYRNNIYIPVDTFEKYADLTAMTLDRDEKKVMIDLSLIDFYVADSETTEFIKQNAGTVYVVMKSLDDTLYVPLNVLAQFGKLAYSISKGKLYIMPYASVDNLCRICADTQGASSLSAGSGQNVDLFSGQVCFLEKEMAAFDVVTTVSGESVYVMKDCVETVSDISKLASFQYTAKTKKDYSDRKINLAWMTVSNGVTPAAPDGINGLDIMAPMWFHQVVGGDGEIQNAADQGFSITCHQNGYEVWATVTNSFTTTGSTKYTTQVLGDKALRDKTIAQYLFYAALYEVDGLNIDYEDLTSADKDNLTAFVRTFAKYTDRMGLTISFDPLVPASFNKAKFDYQAIGNAVDYVCVMSYDEHYSSTGSGAGSVSSHNWVETHLKSLIKMVDPSKVIMGVPLYTRFWKFDSSGKCVGSSAYSVNGASARIGDAIKKGYLSAADISWLDDKHQYYCEFYDGEQTIKTWLEDTRSIADRLNFVYDLGLAGTACWQYSYAGADIYDIFDAVYDRGVQPSEYEIPYR